MSDPSRVRIDPTVLGIGELLWDCFGQDRRPGGAPANVAFHATQLGAKGRIVSRVGCDRPGDELLEHLRRGGLDAELVQRDAVHPTGRVTVDLDRANHPTYTIHEGAAWDHIAFDDALASASKRASAVCFGTLAQRSPRSRETVRRCLESASRALKVYDVNLRPPWYAGDIVDASLELCDVVKLNDEEVAPVAELLGLSGRDAQDVARHLLDRYGLKLVCITRAERGCLMLARDQRVEVPGRAVKVVDAVGAGDAFTAALVCGLLRNRPLEKTARYANQVGALVASHAGATPPLRDEYRRLPASPDRD